MRQQRNSSGSFFVMLQPSGSGQQYSGLPFDPSLLFTSEIAFVSLTNKSISRLRHKTLDTAASAYSVCYYPSHHILSLPSKDHLCSSVASVYSVCYYPSHHILSLPSKNHQCTSVAS